MKIPTKPTLLNTVIVIIFLMERLLIFGFVNRVSDDATGVTMRTAPTLITIPDIGKAYADIRQEFMLWAAASTKEKPQSQPATTAARARLAQLIADDVRAIDPLAKPCFVQMLALVKFNIDAGTRPPPEDIQHQPFVGLHDPTHHSKPFSITLHQQ